MSQRKLLEQLKQLQRLIGVSTASLAALLPAAARAQDPTFGAGVFVGYNLHREGLEWGLEAFATLHPKSESLRDDRRLGVGPLLQFGVMGAEDPRFTFAVQGGGELERALLALTGELGVTYRQGARGGFGVHVGIVPEIALVNLAFRYQVLLDEAWVGLGARMMPTYGALKSSNGVEETKSVPGRPLRSEHGRVQTTAALHAADGGNPGALQRLLGAAWEHDAQLEYASIPAFIQLAHELTALHAPVALVRRALDAARDEAAHAHGCAALAGSHLQHAILPTLPKYTPRPILACRTGMLRLAVESWIDGCLAEGCAALQAARAAELAQPGAAKQLLRRIAGDEHAHAELAWDTLAWALAQAPEEIRETLRSQRDREPSRALEVTAPPELERFGRVSAKEIDRISERHAAESSKRLDGLLSA